MSHPLACPICLDFLDRPVTVPCGHSYCMQCVLRHWNTEGDREGAQEGPCCPQCRQRFDPRPRLALNTVLAELSDRERENEGRRGGREKKLRGGAGREREERRGEDMRTTLDVWTLEERTHQGTVSEDHRCEREEVLQREVLTALQTTEQLLQHLLCLIEPTSSKLQPGTQPQPAGPTEPQHGPPGQTQPQQGPLEQTKPQGPSGQTQPGTISQLQQEHPGWTQSGTNTQPQQGPLGQPHLDNLHRSYTNHLNYKQSLTSLYPPGFLTNISSALSEFQQKLQSYISDEWTSLPQPVPTPLPRTREELLQYSRSICLDSNTANPRVRLSQGNTRAILSRDNQNYGQHWGRFTDFAQVLSEENLSGKSYVEVEWSGWGFYLALASKSVPRSGKDSRFGSGDRSWALHCEKTGYELVHRGLGHSLSGPRSSKVAVFLDQTAGQLSFYSLTPHLHLLHTTSTGPMQHLALGVHLYSVGDYVHFCQPQ
ncbi:E3 ubiquitin/ISG15 ligase TRIM25-like [Periophthalmus magnuspinnatus]|uniref:E3 ubiquitin/ISG15 ligase TRIM25-like n=1 Tax=Periophthalmus magnuspinnatus TaxID=409849 RepID=UPI002436B4D7|nr:E3 ubiquitin/ISG15 ligase TRIM25-like [Periophthalmus magnuspinnatus]